MQGSPCNIAHYRSPSMGREATRCACLAVVLRKFGVFNIDRGTDSQINLLIVRQRNTPRTAIWYYASCWVIGSHLAGTLASRRALCNSLDTEGRLDDDPKRATTGIKRCRRGINPDREEARVHNSRGGIGALSDLLTSAVLLRSSTPDGPDLGYSAWFNRATQGHLTRRSSSTIVQASLLIFLVLRCASDNR